MAKLGIERCGTELKKGALITLSDANQSLREQVISLMLDIAILREKRQGIGLSYSGAVSERRSLRKKKSTDAGRHKLRRSHH